MKNVLLLSVIIFSCFASHAQEFNKQLAEARTAYSARKLDDSRFAMQQMLQDLDIIMGKEVMKLLPAKMLDQQANASNDNVSGASGFTGVVIHRDFGTGDKNVTLEIISNSPLLTMVNSLLSLPMIGGTGDNKVVKIAGYKALLQKVSGDNEKAEYELQVPVNTSLITLKAPGYPQDQLLQMANTIPVAQIAKMLQ
jgi:hypothetical protein